jgi:Xaa-Pro aminopeptidase
VSIIERLQKAFQIQTMGSLDKTMLMVRAIKSPYELHWMQSSGKTHCDFLTNVVPGLLREGINEAEFVGELFNSMVKHGYHGVSRFSMFQTEMVVGQVGFGENSLYPTSFDGPGGALGMSAAVPIVGSRERKLKKGDLVFVDIGFGMNGYHSDKTQVYSFGAQPSDDVIIAHRACIEVQQRLCDMLKPGMIPSQIYQTVMLELSDAMKQNFMGFGKRQARFLGHGIGLHVDEWPVIANGCHDPLQENMVLALEPKKGIAGVGMVGVEDTYIVTPDGGRCITGGGKDIIVI